MRYRQQKLLAFSLAFQLAAWAGLVEASESAGFLSSVPNDSITAKVVERNSYFIDKTTYFSKRFRLVQLDTDFLVQESPFALNLFPDKVLTVEPVRLLSTDQTHGIWRGRIIHPIDARRMNADNPDQAKAWSDYQERQSRIKIVAIRYVRDSQGHLIAPGSDFSVEGYDVSDLRPDPASSKYVFGFGAGFNYSLLNGEYKIKSLPLDPNYQIVYEVDESKYFSPENNGDLENETKRLNHESFLQGLGTDPALIWRQRIKENARKREISE